MSARPVLRIIAGDATPEEIAAVVAAVAAAPAPEQDGEPDATSVWAARGHAHRHVRAAFTPSRDGWRTSFWPR